GGADPAEVAELAAAIAVAPSLRCRGVMAVAPTDADAGEAFERLAVVAADLRVDHPGASIVSAGMSADLEEAVKYGATHVRIGSAVLGRRPRVQ
ncbi:MAG: YggS family pyridoxal phosphate-dependent enzyme, partial [Acidobacteria bacterium]|nr:YggS family pyridoxal phosphate-dependent enzyme [Acidobacteriota bacterium]